MTFDHVVDAVAVLGRQLHGACALVIAGSLNQNRMHGLPVVAVVASGLECRKSDVSQLPDKSSRTHINSARGYANSLTEGNATGGGGLHGVGAVVGDPVTVPG